MNINLISPTTNGNRFTVRFKEDVNIPANSKIYLNHATLSRKGNFFLNQDCELMIVIPQNQGTAQDDLTQNVYPSRTEGDTSVFNTPLYDGNTISRYGKATIPKGVYTYKEMVDNIQTAIDTILTNTNNGANMSLYRSIKISDLDDDYVTGNDADVAFGIIQKGGLGSSQTDSIPMEAFALQTGADANGRDITVNDDGILFTGANKDDGAGISVWNGYGVADKKLNFYNNPDNRPVMEYKGIECVSKQTPQEIAANNGAICIGGFSDAYATGLYGTESTQDADQSNTDDRDRTSGNIAFTAARGNNGGSFNPSQTHFQQRTSVSAITTNANQKNLIMPFTVMLDGRDAGECKLRVQIARMGTNNHNLNFRAYHFANQGQQQKGQTTIFSRTMSQLGLDPADLVSLKIFLTVGGYQANDSDRTGDNPMGGGGISITVLNELAMAGDLPLTDQPAGAILVNKKLLFNMNFLLDQRDNTILNGKDRLDYTRVPCVGSQQPFSVYMAGLKNGEGWQSVHYDPLLGLGNNATKPLTIIRRYGIIADDELANQINVEKKTDFEKNINKNFNYDFEALKRLYYPNTRDTLSTNSTQIATTKMTLPWRRIGYSVKVNSLPLRSYKNTSNGRDGGYSKNILANIPAPFKDSDIEYNAQDTHVVTSTYEPPFKINNNLNNQAFTTNKFDVEIVNSKTDEPATELLNTVINFTIEPPNNVVNQNSIQNIKTL
jgi:hypothetical protein